MRSLRIGVVIAGQLVEERLFSGVVTFGQSLRCAVSLPLDGLPREHVLFARDEGAFVLRPVAGMTARVAIAGEVRDVTAELRLPRGARGKLVLGDATLLFQDIEHVVRPKPALPASLRVHHFDRKLAAIITGSLVVHAAIGVWAWTRDNDQLAIGMREMPASFQQDTIDVQLPDRVERIDPTLTRSTGVATPVTQPHRIVQPPTASPSDPQRLAEDASRMASILTGDEGERGVGGMNHRQPGADLARQMDEAANHTVTIGGSDHTSRVDDRARIGTDRGLQITDPTMQIPAPTHEERTGRIVIKPMPGDDPKTSLTPQMVLDKVSTSYMAGLQRCYRLGQKEDAGLEGKIAIELTVDEHGRVTDPSATGLTSQVDTCMQNQMTAWHFGIPKDADGEATQATFKIALVLKKS